MSTVFILEDYVLVMLAGACFVLGILVSWLRLRYEIVIRRRGALK